MIDIKKVIEDSAELKHLMLNDCLNEIESAVDIMIDAAKKGNKILWCGNGGSAADAQHLSAEFSGRFYKDRKALPAEALHCNSSFLTAVSNDYSFDKIYSRLIDGIGNKGDVLVGISTSGNSKNILNAFEICDKIGVQNMTSIPVFVDWNIGNFSVKNDYSFFSRWDYDWFRMSTRMMDFYFFSRVCSEIGDRTVFSYLIDPLMEERFLLFLKAYHKVYPLTEQEIRILKETYRFFILNYVIKDGRYFFHEFYSGKLQYEAYETYFPNIDKSFDADKILKALDI